MVRAVGTVIGFDLDLTLIDTRPSIAHSLAALGREIDGVELLYPATGIRGRIEDHFSICYPDREPALVAERYRAIYREQSITLAAPLPGAFAAIAAARAFGAAVVITGKHEHNARLHLQHIGLAVDAVAGNRTGPEKAATLRELDAAIYVGDQVEDIEAALLADVAGIGVTTGLDRRASLLAAGATTVLDSLTELPDILRRFALLPAGRTPTFGSRSVWRTPRMR